MHRVLLLGAGKIGRMIATFLQESGDFELCVGDASQEALARIHSVTGAETIRVDASSRQDLESVLRDRDTVVSALSFRFNPLVAELAIAHSAHYFDLSEDVETTRHVQRLASRARTVVMPQCGLAPGFISVVANQITKAFDDALETVHMRVGALPQFPSNALKYNLTWSTDGLINEYCNPCEAIHRQQRINVLALEGLEQFSLDGVRYEAFNTSGGLGTLCETLKGRVRELNYKTIRYPGHRNLMYFLVHDLRMHERREELKEVLENAIPVTFQDVVVTFCTVTGQRKGQLVQISDARKIYSQRIGSELWSAIQITTAAGVFAALDLCVQGKLPASGFLRQEQIDLEPFLENRFGKYFRSEVSTRFTRLQSSTSSRELSDA